MFLGHLILEQSCGSSARMSFPASIAAAADCFTTNLQFDKGEFRARSIQQFSRPRNCTDAIIRKGRVRATVSGRWVRENSGETHFALGPPDQGHPAYGHDPQMYRTRSKRLAAARAIPMPVSNGRVSKPTEPAQRYGPSRRRRFGPVRGTLGGRLHLPAARILVEPGGVEPPTS